MSSKQPTIIAAGPRHRRFTASATAIQAIIVNPAEQVLLMFSPSRNQGWQVVSGALEAGETIQAGTLREVHEELGPDIQVRPLGAVHVETFHFDEQVQYMLSTYYLFAYQGGGILPGDDMAGSETKWWSLNDLDQEGAFFHASTKPWMLKRAVALYRLWQPEQDAPLQPTL